MFGNWFGKKQEIASEHPWAVATAQDNGMPLIIRYREVLPSFPRTQYPSMLAVQWRYESQDNGMPDAATEDRMDLLQDLLMPALEDSGNALLTAVVTGNCIRESQWYVRVMVESMKCVNQALAGQAPFPIEFMMEEDPAWAAYQQFVQ